MDRIEPVGGSSDASEDHHPPSSNDAIPGGTTSYLRPRAPSLRSRRPSIRIQRPPSINSLNLQAQVNADKSNTLSVDSEDALNSRRNSHILGPDASRAVQNDGTANDGTRDGDDGDAVWQGRRRSSSEPRPGRWSASTSFVPPLLTTGDQTNAMPMYSLKEEPSSPQSPIAELPSSQPFSTALLEPPPPVIPRRGSRNVLRRTSEAALNRFSRNRASTVNGAVPVTPPPNPNVNEYHPHMVDVLDVIDPEVAALSTLTNVQNSLFVPNLGSWINRMPTYTLSPPSPRDESSTEAEEGETTETDTKQTRPTLATRLSSVLDEGPERQFAVLPEEMTLEGWTKEEMEELNDRVRHMLHSRRSAFKRSMVGFGKYVSRPLGFLVTLYATLITLFGLAWVLFLIGWINVGGRQLYVINVIDNVLVALFAIMGDGLAPFRAIDTYHMIFIAHYTFLTWKIRKKRDLPALRDKNDLPERREADVDVDIELGDSPKDEEHEFSVLNSTQQRKLMHHQEKFAKSHTFYKPHETYTHHAFPLRLLIAIVVLLDCHSLFQIALGACTWGINYHVRPFALTTVILCCSITCNIMGGVLIMIGDRRTRKKDVVERLFRQQLTEEAAKKMQKNKRKEEMRKSIELRKSLDQSRKSLDRSPLKVIS
ncbi:hypothetical protein IFM58399_03621 [Aspergillus lentulus]|uniref:DUF2985 domain-containing protein n=1 Tax=Aspergillus lentulus TaxID=293939 RepID=UPI001393F4D4|nr:uncharacterized protein IFM58399_03621 [Aspergillus lentulus]GFF33683.1 hypothetical protein IFM58399_03621 [Aspergillus lentulus]GFF74037.1 hypothetical protein IFM47457_03537 [Aspergillus lentulus]GFG07687.1 hypothetical protein IFM61392_04983 [Aspergillus lentulus]